MFLTGGGRELAARWPLCAQGFLNSLKRLRRSLAIAGRSSRELRWSAGSWSLFQLATELPAAILLRRLGHPRRRAQPAKFL